MFDRALGADNVDTIMDFNHSLGDRFILRGGGVAQDADDRIIYDRATGNLYFDPDGTGSAEQVLFAVLDNQTMIAADDFMIV